jgi:hypothetical protein
MRPIGEIPITWGISWIPDYTQAGVPYSMYPTFLKLKNQLEQSEKYGEYKEMTYEDAHDQMKEFLEKNQYTINPHFVFFINQMSKTNAQLAYDNIMKDMNVIDQINPSLYKDPLLIKMMLKWPQILNYIKKNTPEQIAFKEKVKSARIQMNLRLTQKQPNKLGNLGWMGVKHISSYLGGKKSRKNIKKRYATNP